MAIYGKLVGGLAVLGIGMGAAVLAPKSSLVGPTIYAAPVAAGNCSTVSKPCTLTQARVAARKWIKAGKPAPTVVLATGTYRVVDTLALTREDRGTTYEAASGAVPVLSGAAPVVGGWVARPDVGANVYRAGLPAAVVAAGKPWPQELVVNGRYAQRARGEYSPAGWVKKTVAGGAAFNGFQAPDAAIAGYAEPASGTLVGAYYWKTFRVGIESASGANVVARARDWAASQDQLHYEFNTISWVEGWRELVQNGEGYFAIDDGGVWYRPHLADNMATAVAEVPLLDKELVTITGTLDAPDVNVTLRGISFVGRTWKDPYRTAAQNPTANGFSTLQGNIHGIKAEGFQKVPATVKVRDATGITIQANTFRHNAAVGVALERASDNLIEGNLFEESAAGGIQVGDVRDAVEDPHPSDPRAKLSGNEISNNVFVDLGRVYSSSEPVWLGYTDHTLVSYNSVGYAKATAFSVGWGWSLSDAGGTGWPATVPAWATDSVNGYNTVSRNRVDGSSMWLTDTGSIYTIGASPGTTISQNAMLNAFYFAGYADGATVGSTWADNSMKASPSYALVFQTVTGQLSHDNSVSNMHIFGYSTILVGDPSNTVTGTDAAPYEWSSAGLSVLRGAGVQGAHQALRQPNVARMATTGAFASSDIVGNKAHDGVDEYWHTHWCSNEATTPWFLLDLGHAHDVYEVVVIPPVSATVAAHRRNFKVEAALHAAGPWVTIWEQGATPVWHQDILRVVLPTPASYQFIRLTKTVTEVFCLADLQVIGKPSDPAKLWSVDYREWPLGSNSSTGPLAYTGARSAGGGQTFTRTGNGILVRTGSSTAASVAAAALGIAQYGDDATYRGRSHYGALTLMYAIRDPQTGAAGSGVTYTTGYATSPTGADTSTRIQVNSGGYSRYSTYGTTSVPHALSFWVRGSLANPTSTWHYQHWDGVSTNSSYGTASASWAYTYKVFLPQAGVSTVAAMQEDGRAGTGGTPAAGARDVVMDYIQLEKASYPTPYALSGARTGERTYHTVAPYLVSNGYLDFEVSMVMGFPSTAIGAARLLWRDTNDATTFVSLGTNRVVTVSVAGVSTTLPTPAPTWALFDYVVWRVKAGNGYPQGSVSVNGVTTSLGTGSASQGSINTMALDLLSNGTTQQMEGLVVRETAYN